MENSLDSAIRDFATKLDPAPKEMSACKREADEIARMLNEDSKKYNISRIQVCGDFQTRTNVVGNTEAAVIVYLDRDPPYNSLVERIKNLLIDHYKWKQNMPCIPAVDQSNVVSVELGEGIAISVFVAKNFVKSEETRLDKTAQNRRQHERSIAWLSQFRNQPSRLFSYSAHLASAHPEFIIDLMKDAKAAQVIKLCKKWNDGIGSYRFNPNRSVAIDLLAVSAVIQARRAGKKAVIDAFRSFLESWSEIATQKFCRRFEYSEKQGLYSIRDVPQEVRDSRPLLLHPADPFNNKLLPLKDAGLIPQFARKAQETLNLLEFAESNGLTSLDHMFTPLKPVNLLVPPPTAPSSRKSSASALSAT